MQKTLADLQAMVTQQQDALEKETDNRKALASALAKEKVDRKAEMMKEKVDQKAEMALRIAEINRLEEQLSNQKDENDQLSKDLQLNQDKLRKEMSEHAADLKSISEVQKSL